jgi:SnoaL-like domain
VSLDPWFSELVRLERAALERWCNGDPSGFLELCAADVVYFDPLLPCRIDGLPALRDYYDSIRGKVRIARYELLRPLIQGSPELAVLTFNFNSYGGNEDEYRWNCTEVYRRDEAGPRIIQTHWSRCPGGAD